MTGKALLWLATPGEGELKGSGEAPGEASQKSVRVGEDGSVSKAVAE